MLTKEQKQAYLDNPNKCPYCGNENLTTVNDSWRVDDSFMQEVKCGTRCGKMWRDIYTLTAIEEVG